MEIQYLIILLLSTIFIFKSAFYIFALFISFIYYSFIDKLLNKDNIDILPPPNTKHILIKSIGKFINGIMHYTILKTGNIPSHCIRNFIYKNIYKVDMEKNTVIYSGAEIRSPNRLTIGKGSIIGNYSILDARNYIIIGENVNFSHGVWLWTEQHNYNAPDFSCTSSKNKKIVIKDRAWIGPRVIILPGCTIGEGAVIAAGAVVTKDIEPYTLNGGIPCKKIAERNKNLTYIFNGSHLSFI